MLAKALKRSFGKRMMWFTTPGWGDLKFDRGEEEQLKFRPRRGGATKISTETGRDRGWGDLEFDRGGAT